MKIHCLFEQSGTFRDAFRELGFEAYDYDIENKFGKTDCQIDLFNAILLDKLDFISEKDFVFAFFPCTYFSGRQVLNYKCKNPYLSNLTDLEKIEYNRNKIIDLYNYYMIFLKFYKFLIKNKIKSVIENPYSKGNFLTRYFPIEPKIIDTDRTILGDYFRKPTQFFFVNCFPSNNMLQYYYYVKKPINVLSVKGFERSRITREYAHNFIKKNLTEILEK